MAHPDDEVLWASSILRSAKKIVLCFGNTNGTTARCLGRRRVRDAFPLNNVEWLNLDEADVFQSAAWKNIVETAHGVRGARDQDGYAANFDRLTAALAPLLEGESLIVTHNPWGEYGHEEHVQVYRAVAALKQGTGARVYVSSYVSDRAVPFMQRAVTRLGAPTALMATDQDLCVEMKALYIEHDVWTWTDDYAWPTHEAFYPVEDFGFGHGAGDHRNGSPPLNVIRLGDWPLTASEVAGYARGKAGRLARKLTGRR